MDMKLVAETIEQLRAERERVERTIADVCAQMPGHISEHDLERYHLGMVTDDELAALEEHLLWCGSCVDRAEAAAQYVDTMRAAMFQHSEGWPLPCRGLV